MYELNYGDKIFTTIGDGRKIVVFLDDENHGLNVELVDANGESLPFLGIRDCPDCIRAEFHDDVWDDDASFSSQIEKETLKLYEREERKWLASTKKNR